MHLLVPNHCTNVLVHRDIVTGLIHHKEPKAFVPLLRPSMFHSDSALVYARELRAHGYGEPLWQPEPSQYGEVLIGDVGFIADGRFYRLFNATSAADDRVNAEFGVPDGFVPLQYNKRVHLQTNENYLPPGPICSKSMVLAKVDGNARG